MRTVSPRMRTLLAASVAVSALFSGAGASYAQEAAAEAEATEGRLVEEIIVTAQRREQNLQDVPIAVSVFDADKIEQRGITRFTELANSVPNFTYEEAASIRNQRMSIRGISADTRFPGAESAVGVIIDGVYLAGVSGLAFDLADIESVEVLRGPQGTLYGRNTSAGAVTVTTRKPNDEFKARLGIDVGNYELFTAKASISGPISPGKLYGGISVIHKERDGYEVSVDTNSRVNSAGSDGVRLQLRATPTPEWDVSLVGEYTHDDYVAQALEIAPYDRNIEGILFEPTTTRDLWGISLHATRSLAEGMTLKSITSLRRYETSEHQDGDFQDRPVSLNNSTNAETSREFTQEFQLTSPSGQRLEWLVGGFFMDQELVNDGSYDLDIDGYFEALIPFGLGLRDFIVLAPFLPFPPEYTAGLGSDYADEFCTQPAPACVGIVPARVSWGFETQTYAAFSHFIYALTDRLGLELGLRLSHETRDFHYTTEREAGFPLPAGNPLALVFIAGPDTPGFTSPINDDLSQTVFTPKLAATYQFSPDMTGYASVAKGYKSGTFYANILGVSDVNLNGENDYLEFLEVEKETSWNYEAGLKGVLLDRIRYAGAVYFIDYDGLQTQRVLNLGFGAFNFLGNADAEYYGAELELEARVTRDFTLNGGVGYSEAKFTHYPDCSLDGTTGVVLDCTGNRPNYAPKWTASAGADWRRDISGGLELRVGGSWTYRSSQFFEVSEGPALSEGSVSLFNASIGIGADDGRWAVQLYGANLTDEFYKTFGSQTEVSGPGGIGYTYGAPRTYGVRLRVEM